MSAQQLSCLRTIGGPGGDNPIRMRSMAQPWAGVPGLIRGWRPSSGVGILVLRDDGCRDASSLADLDALLLRPLAHG
jgi:hypothetical protein